MIITGCKQKKKNENDKNVHASAKKQKVSPTELDKKTTSGDRISINTNNNDILTRVKDDNSDYINEDDQAH